MNSAIRNLFEGRLVDFLSLRRRSAEAELANQAPAELVAAAPEHLLAYLVGEYGTKALRLETKPRVREWLGSRQDWEGNVIREREVLALEIPFEGDPRLLEYRPDGEFLPAIRAAVAPDRLALEIALDDRHPATAQAAIDAALRPLHAAVAAQARPVSRANEELEAELRTRIEERRRDLREQREFVAGLGLEVSDLPDPARPVEAPAKPRKLELKSAALPPESWALSDETYEAILETLWHMSLVIERCPKAFASLREEVLRMHFLVHLNAVFGGAVTGETFNRKGKADILIRHQGQNLFLAECKFWGGEKQFAETVEQLLGYLTWRDSRAAVLMFVRGTAMSTVLDRIDGILRADARCEEVRSENRRAGEFRVRFRRRGDSRAEVQLAVQCYEVG